MPPLRLRALRRHPWSFLAAGTVVLLIGVNVGLHQYRQQNPVLPGLGGCRTVLQASGYVDCVERHVLRATAGASANTLRQLMRLDAGDPSLRFQDACHSAAHVVADREFRRTPPRADALLRTLDGRDGGQCTYGYLHAAMGALAASDPREVGALGTKVCGELARSAPARNCFHGIGHGLQRGGADLSVAGADARRSAMANVTARRACTWSACSGGTSRRTPLISAPMRHAASARCAVSTSRPPCSPTSPRPPVRSTPGSARPRVTGPVRTGCVRSIASGAGIEGIALCSDEFPPGELRRVCVIAAVGSTLENGARRARAGAQCRARAAASIRELCIEAVGRWQAPGTDRAT